MITVRQVVPTHQPAKVLRVFPKVDRVEDVSNRISYNVDLESALFVRTMRDIQSDPLVTPETTMKELYALYPKLRKTARPVLWKTLRDINWDLEYPLAMIGCVLYRESPKSKTACVDIGKTTLRF